MTILRLAWRNLIGARLRTWLNVLVLSLSFVTIVGMQGLLEGMTKQVQDATVAVFYGGGQYWHQKYDPYDPLSLSDAHGALPEPVQALIRQNQATAVLVTQGSIYPKGRVRPVLLKGIDPAQAVLGFPTSFLNTTDGEIPALIGQRMAQSTGLRAGDYVALQWRDVNGTFDARDAKIVQVMTTSVQDIDNGQVWLPLATLQQLTGMPGQATYAVVGKGLKNPPVVSGWTFRDQEYLLKDLRAVIKTKSAGSSIFYVILMFLAMLAIFDTQVLSLFRRRKEMGTLMALGMTRGQVIGLFTLEGALHGVLAFLLGALYGIPLLWWLSSKGIAMPKIVDSMGFAIGDSLYPAYGASLVVGTTLLVLIITTIVSYLPTRRIAKLKPTDALRGRWS
jgi:ABC-type lipoprotein release transport system permease subunit